VLCLLIGAYFAVATIYALWRYPLYASETPQFLRYVAAPAALSVAFFAITAFAPARVAQTIGAYAGAILGGLFLFEAYLTVGVVRTTLGLLGEVKAGTGSTKPTLPPSYTLIRINRSNGSTSLQDAVLAGIPGETIVACARKGVPVRYQADRFGFNNPDAVHDLPGPTLAVLGDSFVEGLCLDPSDNLVSRIRADFPRTVGLGMRGNGPLLELATLGRYGAVLKPPVSLMVFFEGNDWENLVSELRVPWIRDALKSDDFGGTAVDPAVAARLRESFASFHADDSKLIDLLRRTSVVRNFLSLYHTGALFGLSYPKVAPPQPTYERVLGRANEIAARWQGQVVLVYLPVLDRFHGATVGTAWDGLRAKVLAAAQRTKVPVIDLTPVFSARPDVLSLYAPDAHLSEEGARVVAKAITTALKVAPHPSGPNVARSPAVEEAQP
jgi:hypothetical protein